MAQSNLPEWVSAGLEVIRSFAPIAASLCGGGVVWKLVEKLIDVFEARRKERADNEGETNKDLRLQNKELREKNFDLVKDAAQVPFLVEDKAELRRQLEQSENRVHELEREKALKQVEHEREIRRMQGELAQKDAVHSVLWEIFRLMDTPNGQEYLRQERARRNTR